MLDASGRPLTVVSFVGKVIFSRTFFICPRVPPSAPKFLSGDLAVFAAVCFFQSLKVSFSLFKVSTTKESLELISFRHSLVIGSSSTSSVEIVDFPSSLSFSSFVASVHLYVCVVCLLFASFKISTSLTNLCLYTLVRNLNSRGCICRR